MPIPVEPIPDVDELGRLIYFPVMYRDSEDLVFGSVFQFPTDQGNCECLVWSKYAPIPAGMHEIGFRDLEIKKERRANARYDGFKLVTAGHVRNLQTTTGHGFNLIHEPAEGDYHALVSFRIAANTNFNKSEKNDLKARLFQALGPLVSPANG